MFYLFCGHASVSSLVSKKILVRALSRNGLKFFLKENVGNILQKQRPRKKWGPVFSIKNFHCLYLHMRYFLQFYITKLDIISTHLPRNGESFLLETMKINLQPSSLQSLFFLAMAPKCYHYATLLHSGPRLEILFRNSK